MRGAHHTVLTIIFLLLASSGLQAQGRIPWVTSWQDASSLAHRYQRLVLIHFWSNNCPPCLALEHSVFNRQEVIRAVVSNYVPLKVNVDANAELARYYQVQQWPTDVIVTAQGAEVFRGPTSQDPNRFIASLDQIAAHARLGVPFSGSPSTDVAAVSRDSDLVDRSSPFLPGGVGNAAGSVPAMSPGTAPSGGHTPLDARTPQPNNPMLPTSVPIGAAGPERAPAIDQTAPVGAFVTNPMAHNPTAAAGSSETTLPYSPPNTTLSPWAGSSVPRGGDNPAIPVPNQPGSDTLGAPSPLTTPSDTVAAGRTTTQSPKDSPTLALEGYCSVTLVEREQWVKGDSQWGAIHRGRTYLFTGREQQQRFLANFDQYAPALSGFDCVKYAEQGALVNGKREHGVFYRGQVFLFADEEALKRFWAEPGRYVPLVRAEQERQATRR